MLISRWISKRYPDSQTILAIAVLILSIAGSASFALADGEVALMNRVNAALRINDRLNGAKAYTAAPGVVVLYGMVFDDKDRTLAEQAADGVNGVTQVVDNLRTKTGKWFQEEERINAQLLMNGCPASSMHFRPTADASALAPSGICRPFRPFPWRSNRPGVNFVG